MGVALVRALPTPRASGLRRARHPVGAGASSDRLRQRARCTACGNKGATIQHPGWGGNDVGFLPFPT